MIGKPKKENANQEDRRKREKPKSIDQEKDSLGQPINMTGGRTLGTGCAAPGGDHGDRPPRGRRDTEAAAVAAARV